MNKNKKNFIIAAAVSDDAPAGTDATAGLRLQEYTDGTQTVLSSVGQATYGPLSGELMTPVAGKAPISAASIHGANLTEVLSCSFCESKLLMDGATAQRVLAAAVQEPAEIFCPSCGSENLVMAFGGGGEKDEKGSIQERMRHTAEQMNEGANPHLQGGSRNGSLGDGSTPAPMSLSDPEAARFSWEEEEDEDLEPGMTFVEDGMEHWLPDNLGEDEDGDEGHSVLSAEDQEVIAALTGEDCLPEDYSMVDPSVLDESGELVAEVPLPPAPEEVEEVFASAQNGVVEVVAAQAVFEGSSQVVAHILVPGQKAIVSRVDALGDMTPLVELTASRADPSMGLLFQDQNRLNALMAQVTANANFKPTAETFQKLGGRDLKYTYPADAAINEAINKRVAAASAQAQEDQAQLKARFEQSLRIAARDVMNNLRDDTPNPLRDSLVKRVESMGVTNACDLVDEAMEEGAQPFCQVLSARTFGLMKEPDEVRNALARDGERRLYRRLGEAVAAGVSSPAAGAGVTASSVAGQAATSQAPGFDPVAVAAATLTGQNPSQNASLGQTGGYTQAPAVTASAGVNPSQTPNPSLEALYQQIGIGIGTGAGLGNGGHNAMSQAQAPVQASAGQQSYGEFMAHNGFTAPAPTPMPMAMTMPAAPSITMPAAQVVAHGLDDVGARLIRSRTISAALGFSIPGGF